MSGCGERTYDDFSPEAFGRLAAKAAEHGVTIEGASGNASKSGFDISWNYAPVARKLVLHCTDKPFFIGCSTVNGRMDEMVNACRDF